MEVGEDPQFGAQVADGQELEIEGRSAGQNQIRIWRGGAGFLVRGAGRNIDDDCWIEMSMLNACF
jgi:hypothetical protein